MLKTSLEDPNAVIFRDLKQKEAELDDARLHYQTLFMEAPVRIFEEDFSLAKKEIDRWRNNGKKDLRALFKAQPEAIRRCCELVRVLSWNKEAERFFPDFPWKTGISLQELFPEVELADIEEEFIAISQGKRSMVYETLAYFSTNHGNS